MWLLFSVFVLLTALLSAAYAGLIFYILKVWGQLPDAAPAAQQLPAATVLVPARNEAGHLEACLHSLCRQDYPGEALHVLVLDDHSEDHTAAIAASFSHLGVALLKMEGHPPPEGARAYKKWALTTGIAHADTPIILTTDADCVLPPTWAREMAGQLGEGGWAAVSGPVLCELQPTALSRFQALDFAGMMVVTAAGLRSGAFTLGNGASLGFRKTAFEEVGGYAGNEQYASGDDVFLLGKLNKAFPGQVGFLKSATAAVQTQPKPTWKELAEQRLRWGTKNKSAAQGLGSLLALGTVFGLSLSILASPFLALAFGWRALLWGSALFAFKAAADYTLLRRAALYFRQQPALRHFWGAEALHTGYIALIGLWALFRKEYEWKGRRVS